LTLDSPATQFTIDGDLSPSEPLAGVLLAGDDTNLSVLSTV